MKQRNYSYTLYSKIFLTVFISGTFIVLSCNKPEKLKPVESVSADAGVSRIPAPGRPNIVILLADDVGYDAIACNGNQSFETPNINQLAQEGMRFTQCHGAPTCSPSRFMFVTGKYNFRNYTKWGVMNPNEKTFSNIAKDCGYKTYVAGKWQFDGGQTSITNFGYDGYCLWDAQESVIPASIYKSPKYYENGVYVGKSVTDGMYGDDIFTSRILSFIQQNKANNFFVYYPIGLCHYPFSPTPDNPEFADWAPGINNSNEAFFPSMIKYMDKKVGQIVDSLKAWQLYDNTIVMFVGDNGTPHGIYYYYNGVLTQGGKTLTTEAGTKVPLIVTWPNGITAGQVNNNLVSFTDFLPTIADATGTSIPASYGVIDGKSFYNQLTGQQSTPRDWIFCHYNQLIENSFTNSEGGSASEYKLAGQNKLRRWVQNTNYKLYDSTGKFYNIIDDIKEKSPITASKITSQEQLIKDQFQSIMDTLH